MIVLIKVIIELLYSNIYIQQKYNINIIPVL